MKKLLILFCLCFCIVSIEAQTKQEKKSKKIRFKDEKGIVRSDTVKVPYMNLGAVENKEKYLSRGTFRSETITIDSMPIQLRKEDLTGGDLDFDPSIQEAKFFALLVAVSDYLYEEGAVKDLTMPILDAQNLKEVLSKEYSFEPQRIKLLENATRSDIINALETLADSVTANDHVLIYYAGHGIYDPLRRTGYWQLADAKLKDKSTWFSNVELKDYISKINSRHTLLIADACFSGAIFTTRGEKDLQAQMNKGIKAMYEKSSRIAITSATNSTPVPDDSIFMRYLLETLQRNPNDFLSAEDLYIIVKKATTNDPEAEQIPQYGKINVGFSENFDGDFIFIKKRAFKK